MNIIRKFSAVVPTALCLFATSADAQAVLVRKPAGSPVSNFSTAGFPVCQPSGQSDFQVRRFVPGMIQGFFQFEWTLFKDGQVYKSVKRYFDLRSGNAFMYQNYTYAENFLALPTDPGTYAGKLEVRKRGGFPGNYNYNQLVINDVSPTLTISQITPTHSFTIRNSSGVFVSPPPNGAPIPVSLSGGIIMDASASQCETGYLVIVQESNIYWDRPLQNELDKKWLSGQAPANINLQQFVTTYSQSDGTGYFSLMGGSFTSGPLAGQPRYYRVGLQAAGAPWNPRMTLIQVGW